METTIVCWGYIVVILDIEVILGEWENENYYSMLG